MPGLERFNVEEVLVAGNRGPCGGVNMALEAARQVLDIVDGREPVFSNWDLVNNRPVMEELGKRGLQSVKNDWERVPEDSIVFFSAHGVPPRFHGIAKEKNFTVIDATCQLVNRVHNLVKRAEQKEKHIVYIGVKNHPETMGVLGTVKNTENATFIAPTEDVTELDLPSDKPIVVYSQTTLSTAEVTYTMDGLKRLPNVEIPSRMDICYAADNRQSAVNKLVEQTDLLLVVGSKHSHNSQELRRIGDKNNKPAYSVDTPDEIDRTWFAEDVIKRVGVASGASVLEKYTNEVLGWFREQDVVIRHLPQVIEEKDMTFRLPQASIDAIKRRYEK